MKEGVFQINNRFWVDSRKNEMWDSEKGRRTRLEPRLMRLLCLLAERCGTLVTREDIVQEIWNGYPGANEGLNQAISFLRKQLADDSKTMIKTVPKAGYSFHAALSWPTENVPGKKINNKQAKPAAVGFVSLLLLLIIVYYTNRKNSGTDLNLKKAIEISRRDSIHQAETMKPLKEK